jgi:tRNA A-37 threonylcarbamoyl transferase component Bud32
MAYVFDAVNGKLVWMEKPTCDWCGGRLTDFEMLAAHQDVSQRSHADKTEVQACFFRAVVGAEDIRQKKDKLSGESTTQDIVRDVQRAKDEERTTRKVVGDDQLDENSTIPIERPRPGIPTDFDSYASSAPKSSFLSSSSFRSSPIATWAQQRNNYGSITSPKSYQSALSSVASYATAPSVSHHSFGMTSLKSGSDTYAWNGISKDGQKSKLFPLLEKSDTSSSLLRDPHEAIQPLVSEVYAHILKVFGSSEHVQSMSNADIYALRVLVRSCLWSLTYGVDDAGHGAEGQIGSQRNKQLKDKQEEKSARLAQETSNGVPFCSDTQDAIEDDWEFEPEPLDNLMRRLRNFTLKASRTKVLFELESHSNYEALRNYLAQQIEQYMRVTAKPAKLVADPVFSSEWLEHLHDRGILLDPKDELNWSGRGQHVEYDAKEEIDIPLAVKKVLGYSATAIVESVQCRRILLARKTVKCNRKLPKEEVVTEVENLQRLQHSHIVRIVGTYTLRRSLAILLYPVADWNLEEFMDDIVELERTDDEHGIKVMPTMFGCLSSAIGFIHDKNVKHMDIKPKNILVRRVDGLPKVYIADFGIARSYKSPAEAFTDTPTSFTRTYAAPEVVQQDKRGYPADIFSLGCVFMEMVAVMMSTPYSNQRDQLARARGVDYQSSILEVTAWYLRLVDTLLPPSNAPLDETLGHALVDAMPYMLDAQPWKRPGASSLKRDSEKLRCPTCDDGPEPFAAADAKSACAAACCLNNR